MQLGKQKTTSRKIAVKKGLKAYRSACKIIETIIGKPISQTSFFIGFVASLFSLISSIITPFCQKQKNVQVQRSTGLTHFCYSLTKRLYQIF